MTKWLPESWFLLGVVLVDVSSTVWLIQQGHATEGNPLLGFYLSYGLEWFLVAKAVLLGLIPIGLLEWIRQAYPWRERVIRLAVRIGLLGYMALYAVGVAHVNR